MYRLPQRLDMLPIGNRETLRFRPFYTAPNESIPNWVAAVNRLDLIFRDFAPNLS